ncbi:MAG: hypothetical protein QOD53_2335, partial [Thermoleophilaceae bacterium]|nr:hypothetical protein [Thermoleophilaceae bacterium]
MPSENQPIHTEMPTVATRLRPRRLTLGGLAALAVVVAVAVLAGSGSPHHAAGVQSAPNGGTVVSLGGSARPAQGGPPATASAGESDAEASQAFPESRSATHHAAARAPHKNTASMATGVSPGAPSDAQVRAELKQLQRGGAGAAGARAILQSNGLAEAPLAAPDRG